MALVTDMGWCVARLEVGNGEPELIIFTPSDVDTPANSLSVVGWEALLALRELLNDGVKLSEEQAELAKSLPGDIDTGGELG